VNPEYAIIIPVQNEAACLGDVLAEIKKCFADNDDSRFAIAVGLNACIDNSRQIAGNSGVLVGETADSGYGHGCMAAIHAANAALPDLKAYIFVAGDGANFPDDIIRLADAFESDNGGEKKTIMGLRKFELATWSSEFGRALPNLLLGIACAALGGQFFHDLGPLRLIERRLFEKIDPQELTWGWTIEAQIMAARFGEAITPITVSERPRLSGEQKVSGVSLTRSAKIGWKIFLAAVRTRFRKLDSIES